MRKKEEKLTFRLIVPASSTKKINWYSTILFSKPAFTSTPGGADPIGPPNVWADAAYNSMSAKIQPSQCD